MAGIVWPAAHKSSDRDSLFWRYPCLLCRVDPSAELREQVYWGRKRRPRKRLESLPRARCSTWQVNERPRGAIKNSAAGRSSLWGRKTKPRHPIPSHSPAFLHGCCPDSQSPITEGWMRCSVGRAEEHGVLSSLTSPASPLQPLKQLTDKPFTNTW